MNRQLSSCLCLSLNLDQGAYDILGSTKDLQLAKSVQKVLIWHRVAGAKSEK